LWWKYVSIVDFADDYEMMGISAEIEPFCPVFLSFSFFPFPFLPVLYVVMIGGGSEKKERKKERKDRMAFIISVAISLHTINIILHALSFLFLSNQSS